MGVPYLNRLFGGKICHQTGRSSSKQKILAMVVAVGEQFSIVSLIGMFVQMFSISNAAKIMHLICVLAFGHLLGTTEDFSATEHWFSVNGFSKGTMHRASLKLGNSIAENLVLNWNSTLKFFLWTFGSMWNANYFRSNGSCYNFIDNLLGKSLTKRLTQYCPCTAQVFSN